MISSCPACGMHVDVVPDAQTATCPNRSCRVALYHVRAVVLAEGKA